MCVLLTGGNLMWTGLLASVLFLVLIAVERYHHQSGYVVTKLKSIVTVLWIYAFVWQIPAFAFFRHSKLKPNNVSQLGQILLVTSDLFGGSSQLQLFL